MPIVKGMTGINNILGIEGEHNKINASLAVVLCNSWFESSKKIPRISGINQENQGSQINKKFSLKFPRNFSFLE